VRKWQRIKCERSMRNMSHFIHRHWHFRIIRNVWFYQCRSTNYSCNLSTIKNYIKITEIYETQGKTTESDCNPNPNRSPFCIEWKHIIIGWPIIGQCLICASKKIQLKCFLIINGCAVISHLGHIYVRLQLWQFRLPVRQFAAKMWLWLD